MKKDDFRRLAEDVSKCHICESLVTLPHIENSECLENDDGKNRKIYGIICLNSPSNELIKKVRADNRMRLFEYQISYREV